MELDGSNSPEKLTSVTLDKWLRLKRKKRADMNAMGETESNLCLGREWNSDSPVLQAVDQSDIHYLPSNNLYAVRDVKPLN